MQTPQKRIAMLAGFIILLQGAATVPAQNSNPTVLPINSSAFGGSYGDWAAAWFQWAMAIPAAQNPVLDSDGSFADVGQSGKVWFLAGTFGGTATRDVTIPKGKAIFFPVINSFWWAPEDLELAAFVAEEFYGLDASQLSDEELITRLTLFQITFESLEMSCIVDGKPIVNLEQYFAVSPAFNIGDTDLLDDLGLPIADDNLSVAAGYWLMLAPLTPGQHTIQFQAESEHTFFGSFDVGVTYNITVE